MLRYILLILVILAVGFGSYLFLLNKGFLSQSLSDQNSNLTASPSPEPADTANLVEKNWTWVDTSLSSGQKVTPIAEGSFVLFFTADGKISSKTDCNNFMGSYETKSPDNITIIVNASTMMACPEGSQEQVFIKYINDAETFSINKSNLTLNLKDSSTMIFTAPQN